MADDIAKRHELAIADHFLRFLNLRLDADYGSPEPNEAPDALSCDSSGAAIGVEVTCPNYSLEEARNVWAPARGKPHLSERYVQPGESIAERLRAAPVLMNFTPALMRNAQEAIDSHSLRRYGLPTYLIVDLSLASLTTSDNASQFVRSLRVPAASRFIGLFVALARNFSSQVEFFEVDQR
jgi:hypothetical protein